MTEKITTWHGRREGDTVRVTLTGKIARLSNTFGVELGELGTTDRVRIGVDFLGVEDVQKIEKPLAVGDRVHHRRDIGERGRVIGVHEDFCWVLYDTGLRGMHPRKHLERIS